MTAPFSFHPPPETFPNPIRYPLLMISYEKLKVYQLSLDTIEACIEILNSLPKGYSDLNSQLKRAIFSVSLNIAEGAGKSVANDKKHFYEIARGSAMESAAVIDITYRLKFIDNTQYFKIKDLLHRIICMLSKLCLMLKGRGLDNLK